MWTLSLFFSMILTATIRGPLLRFLYTEITQQVVAVASNKLWQGRSSRTRYVAGPEGQPNIGCWTRGPAKVCRPWNVAAVKGILTQVKNRLDNLGEYRYIFLLGKHEYCAVYRMSIIFSKPKGHDYIFV